MADERAPASPELLAEVEKLNKFRRGMWSDIHMALPGVVGDYRQGVPLKDAVRAHLGAPRDPMQTAQLKADIIQKWMEGQEEKTKQRGETVRSLLGRDDELFKMMLENSVDVAKAQGTTSAQFDQNAKRAMGEFHKTAMTAVDNAVSQALGGSTLDKGLAQELGALATQVPTGGQAAEANLQEIYNRVAHLPPGPMWVAMRTVEAAHGPGFWLHIDKMANSDEYSVANQLQEVRQKALEVSRQVEANNMLQDHYAIVPAHLEEARKSGLQISDAQANSFLQMWDLAKEYNYDFKTIPPEEIGGLTTDMLGDAAPDPQEELAELLKQFEENKDPFTLREAREQFFSTPLWTEYTKKMLGDEWTPMMPQNEVVRRNGLRALRQELRHLSRKARRAAGEWRDKTTGEAPTTDRPAPSKGAQLVGGEGESEKKTAKPEEVRPEEWEFATTFEDEEALAEGFQSGTFAGGYTLVMRKKATGELKRVLLDGLSLDAGRELMNQYTGGQDVSAPMPERVATWEKTQGDLLADDPEEQAVQAAKSTEIAPEGEEDSPSREGKSRPRFSLGAATDVAKNVLGAAFSTRPREYGQALRQQKEDKARKSFKSRATDQKVDTIDAMKAKKKKRPAGNDKRALREYYEEQRKKAAEKAFGGLSG